MSKPRAQATSVDAAGRGDPRASGRRFDYRCQRSVPRLGPGSTRQNRNADRSPRFDLVLCRACWPLSNRVARRAGAAASVHAQVRLSFDQAQERLNDPTPTRTLRPRDLSPTAFVASCTRRSRSRFLAVHASGGTENDSCGVNPVCLSLTIP